MFTLDPSPVRALRRNEPREPESTESPGAGTVNDGAPRKVRIRCPRCAWEPRDVDRWACTCGYIWNTFHTRGKCPGCSKQWRETACLRCTQWSLHEKWYAQE